MRFSLFLAAILAPMTLATIIPRDGPIQNTYNEMQDIIDSGNSDNCLPIVVIFARGTFDSGNVGYWVGPDLLEAFPKSKVARQGVDAEEYLADLKGYLEGGSRRGARAMAATINAYLDLCPDAKVIISGWSQGALVGHLALDLLDADTANNNVAALITFGDPYKQFDMFHLRVRVDHFHSPCIVGDFLCTKEEWNVAEIFGDVKSFIQNTAKELGNIDLHKQRFQEIQSLVDRFVTEAKENKVPLAGKVVDGEARKLALGFNHFLYGHLRYGQKAATWAMTELPAIEALL